MKLLSLFIFALSHFLGTCILPLSFPLSVFSFHDPIFSHTFHSCIFFFSSTHFMIFFFFFFISLSFFLSFLLSVYSPCFFTPLFFPFHFPLLILPFSPLPSHSSSLSLSPFPLLSFTLRPHPPFLPVCIVPPPATSS